MKQHHAETGGAVSDLKPVVIKELTDHDYLRWDEFVQSCPEATFFHLCGWREIMERVFRHRTLFLYAERESKIIGVLPLAEVKSLIFGHSVVSLPFMVYGGCAVNDTAAVNPS